MNMGTRLAIPYMILIGCWVLGTQDHITSIVPSVQAEQYHEVAKGRKRAPRWVRRGSWVSDKAELTFYQEWEKYPKL